MTDREILEQLLSNQKQLQKDISNIKDELEGVHIQKINFFHQT